jgi:hypothetical protein
MGTVSLTTGPELVDGARWNTVGWEKDTRGKTAPRLADLSSMMDPKRYNFVFLDLDLVTKKYEQAS